MPEFNYAKGRIVESIQFISEEISEFENDYSKIQWADYQGDKKTVQMFKQQQALIVDLSTEILGREQKKGNA